MSNNTLSAPFFAVRSNTPRAVAPLNARHTNGHVSSGHGRVAPAAPTLRRDSDKSQCVKLTRREIEVLTLVIEGSSSTEVADKLFVSKRTVDFHLANVYRKLSVKSRLQAYHEAMRRGLLPDAMAGSGLSAAR